MSSHRRLPRFFSDPHGRVRCCLVLGMSLFLASCGPDGPELGTVQGVVTLDGTPLEGARVMFQPQGDGAPSTGFTNETGKYELIYTVRRNGALVGTHNVTVSTYRQLNEGEMPETVPERYNDKSDLVRQVEAGRNTIDLVLEGE